MIHAIWMLLIIKVCMLEAKVLPRNPSALNESLDAGPDLDYFLNFDSDSDTTELTNVTLTTESGNKSTIGVASTEPMYETTTNYYDIAKNWTVDMAEHVSGTADNSSEVFDAVLSLSTSGTDAQLDSENQSVSSAGSTTLLTTVGTDLYTTTQTSSVSEIPESSSPVAETSEIPVSSSPVAGSSEIPESISPIAETSEIQESSSPVAEISEIPESSSPVAETSEIPVSNSPVAETSEIKELSSAVTVPPDTTLLTISTTLASDPLTPDGDGITNYNCLTQNLTEISENIDLMVNQVSINFDGLRWTDSVFPIICEAIQKQLLSLQNSATTPASTEESPQRLGLFSWLTVDASECFNGTVIMLEPVKVDTVLDKESFFLLFDRVLSADDLRMAVMASDIEAQISEKEDIQSAKLKSIQSTNDPIFTTALCAGLITVTIVAILSTVILICQHYYSRKYYGEWILNESGYSKYDELDQFNSDGTSALTQGPNSKLIFFTNPDAETNLSILPPRNQQVPPPPSSTATSFEDVCLNEQDNLIKQDDGRDSLEPTGNINPAFEGDIDLPSIDRTQSSLESLDVDNLSEYGFEIRKKESLDETRSPRFVHPMTGGYIAPLASFEGTPQ